jgi:hypothetical protein
MPTRRLRLPTLPFQNERIFNDLRYSGNTPIVRDVKFSHTFPELTNMADSTLYEDYLEFCLFNKQGSTVVFDGIIVAEAFQPAPLGGGWVGGGWNSGSRKVYAEEDYGFNDDPTPFSPLNYTPPLGDPNYGPSLDLTHLTVYDPIWQEPGTTPQDVRVVSLVHRYFRSPGQPTKCRLRLSFYGTIFVSFKL